MKLTEQKRLDIVQAAATEFAANGFSATSMDVIAETAKVSKRTVYNHFDSKNDLFRAITQDFCDRVIAVSEHDYDATAPLDSQLRRIARDQVALYASPDFLGIARMISAECLAAPDLTRSIFEETFEKTGFGVQRWIAAATADGRLYVENAEIAGKQFFALLEAFALWPQLYDVRPIPAEQEQVAMIDSAVTMFLNTYQA